MSGWSLLIPGTSFSMHKCVDWGLTGRPALQHASPPFSSLLQLSFLLPFLPWMLVHPRCLRRPLFLLDGDILRMIASDHHFCFILRDKTFSFSRRVMPWSSLRSVVGHCFALAFIRRYDVVLKFNVTCTGGLVRGHPISHSRCSRFYPTPRSELCPTPLFESELRSAPISELRSAFTSGVTTDVK